MEKQFQTPILLIIFNRPDITKKLFDVIKKIKPSHLFIAADGPRKNKKNEELLCKNTRKIFDQINWECKIEKDFIDNNIGCDKRVITAVDWFFTKIAKGIILEDDCTPDISFFYMCESLLEKYENNYEIMHINGSNLMGNTSKNNESYYFSNYSHSWGWATWKRAWKYFDPEMKQLKEFKKNKKINVILSSKAEINFWLPFFKKLFNKKFTFWDSKWQFTIFNKNGICITPNKNLISNIGFGNDATHTISDNGLYEIETSTIANIIHPSRITVSKDNDLNYFNKFVKTTFLSKVSYKLLFFIKKSLPDLWRN